MSVNNFKEEDTDDGSFIGCHDSLVEVKLEEDNGLVPLDLSMRSKKRDRESGTESDDSTGRSSPVNNDVKAYKKTLMERYRKCDFISYLLVFCVCVVVCVFVCYLDLYF